MLIKPTLLLHIMSINELECYSSTLEFTNKYAAN